MGYPGNGLAFLIEKKTDTIAILFFIRRLHLGYPENEMACLIEKRTAFHEGNPAESSGGASRGISLAKATLPEGTGG